MPPSAPFEAPSLEGLRATVPSPKTVRKEDVVARIEQLRTELGDVQVLAAGEVVAAGDEVAVDTVGYAGGQVLAFTAATGRRLVLKPDPELPGFTEGIVGMAVGGWKRIQIQLPPDWSELPQRLATAVFDVELKWARRVVRAKVLDLAFLEKLGGGTLDEAGQRVAKRIEQEWRQEAEGRAVKEIVAKLCARVSWRVPEEEVDAEIEARWRDVEGALLRNRKVPEEMQRAALEAWLGKPRLREEVAQQIKESRVLDAVAEREGVEVDPANLLQEAGPVLAAAGLDAPRAQQLLESDPRFRARLTEQARRYKTVELVMSRAKTKVSNSVWGI